MLARAGVEVVSAEAAEQRCGLKAAGLFLPYRTLDGAAVRDEGEGYGRLRIAEPAGAKKYHQAMGSGVHAYLPPGLADTAAGGDLFLIEGEFKSLALMEAGFPAVGISGFFGFAVKGGESLASELAEALQRLKPARVLFCGDSDTALNFQFAVAAVRCATLLAPVPVLLPRLPYDGPGKGADDCRQALGDAFPAWWRQRIDEAIPVRPGTDTAALALELFQREEKAIGDLTGDARLKAETRLVKLAAALERDLLLQERIVAFAERRLKLRRSVFKKAVDAAVKSAAQSAEPGGLEAFYDPGRKSYWMPNNRSEMIEVSEAGLCRHLRAAGFAPESEGGALSALEEHLNWIQRAQDVAYAGPLAGHRVGLQDMCGQRVLVTRSPRILQPARGVWRNPSSAHRGLAFVGFTTQKPCGEARRFEVEAKPVLSRLAYHRRHRLWQDEFRHQSTRSSSFSERADLGRPVH